MCLTSSGGNGKLLATVMVWLYSTGGALSALYPEEKATDKGKNRISEEIEGKKRISLDIEGKTLERERRTMHHHYTINRRSKNISRH